MLTVPHATRHRLAYNAKLLGKVTQAFLAVGLAFYKKRSGRSGGSERRFRSVATECLGLCKGV